MRPLLALSLIVSVGCTRVYTPPPAHIPTLTPADESAWSSSAGFHGIDLRGAWPLIFAVGIRHAR